jgi:hypothetical protein
VPAGTPPGGQFTVMTADSPAPAPQPTSSRRCVRATRWWLVPPTPGARVDGADAPDAAAGAPLHAEEALCAEEAQQMDAQLGVMAPASQVEDEALCVVCMDARKQHVMVPCMHVCVCEACAQRLLDAQTPHCPVCRTPVNHSTRVFF